MAIGEKYNKNTGKLFIFKIKTTDENKKKLESPIFEIREKNEQGQWVITQTNSVVSGDLVKTEVKEGEFEGQKTYNINLHLKDNEVDETYILDLKLNMLTRGLLNSILNIPETNDLKISLYTGKNEYPATALRVKGQLVKWKYSVDDLPKPEEVKFKGKIQRDYSAVDDFFIEKIKAFGGNLNKSNSKTENKSKKSTKKVEKDLDEIEGELQNGNDSEDSSIF